MDEDGTTTPHDEIKEFPQMILTQDPTVVGRGTMPPLLGFVFIGGELHLPLFNHRRNF
jgi:hypothetical protein